jgi:hypothetical protein
MVIAVVAIAVVATAGVLVVVLQAHSHPLHVLQVG